MRVKVQYTGRHEEDLRRITYGAFMRRYFLPKYKGDVEASTFSSHRRMFMLAIDRFDLKNPDSITVRDCEEYRTWSISTSGFLRDYANVCYVAFRQSLGYAVHLELLTTNVAMKTKAIPKGNAVAKYWTMHSLKRCLVRLVPRAIMNIAYSLCSCSTIGLVFVFPKVLL